jgi:hypothetical protein
MLASLVIEQEPLHWQNFPAALERWTLIVGAFSAVFIVVRQIAHWLRGTGGGNRRPSFLGLLFGSRAALAAYDARVNYAEVKPPAWQAILFRWLALGMLAGYIAWAVLMAPLGLSLLIGAMEGEARLSPALGSEALRRYVLVFGSACAVLAAALPFLADFFRLRWSGRRIWALTRLSFKEAVRRKVLWVFSAFVLIILFASWFMPYKSEYQLRNYVTLVYLATAILFLFAASLLAAFSLPADMKNQTIHTIVTKPVERFEIVLGRFFGYMLLLSLVLAVITGAGLIYLSREIDPEARAESMRARVPVFGELLYRGKEGTSPEGINVGREWGYRSYIMGGPNSSQRAIWNFFELPAELGRRPSGSEVPCEFSLDIFRTVKGEEGKGVFCSFFFQTHNWNQQKEAEYRQAREQVDKLLQIPDRRQLIDEACKQIRGASPTDLEINAFVEDNRANSVKLLVDQLLAEKYGYYEVLHQEIVDYHMQSIDVPATLFKNALSAPPQQKFAGFLRPGEERAPYMAVAVKCESGGQYVGAARYDLYILAADGLFAWNFFKGAIGLWMRLCIVVGLAVMFSTYLSGVISWLATMFLYVAGVCQDYVRKLAEGLNPEGGPLISIIKLINKESIAAQVDPTPGAHIAQGADWAFRGVFRVVLYLFPDVNRLDWTEYVAEGFNIGGFNMILIHLLIVAGYLAPCALVAYYWMKSREVAA